MNPLFFKFFFFFAISYEPLVVSVSVLNQVVCKKLR